MLESQNEYEYDFENRMVSPEYVPEDADTENPLRPKTLSEYIGQEKAKENLSIFIEAAKQRKESLDHVCSMARPAWARPPWRESSPTSCM